jgi:hypothetical protein
MARPRFFMAPDDSLPWLGYSGQTTLELLACKRSHRIDSLLCAFEEGIQAKLKLPGNGDLTAEENLVLAVMALDREVNNGGYHQFFLNSSCRFVRVILDYLNRLDCAATATITRNAIAALELPELSAEAVGATIRTPNRARNKILDACDRAFYQLNEIAPALFAYIETHADWIQLVRISLPPTEPIPQIGNAAKLLIHLMLAKKSGLTLDGARQLARERAEQQSMAATASEVEGAAVLYAFSRAVRSRDLAAAEPLAPQAFELMRENTMHSVLYRDWVLQLIDAAELDLADAATRAYLEYLSGCDQSTRSTYNRILFWAEVLKKYPTALPKSVEFFRTHFSAIDLTQPLPPRRFMER